MFKSILSQVKKDKTKSTQSEQKVSDLDDLVPSVPSKPKVSFEVRTELVFQNFLLASKELSTVHYIPEFINGEQHEYLMNSVYENGSRFNSLVHAKRRVQKYGGDVNSLGLENIEKLPPFVEHLKQVLETQQIIDKPINHALINEYERGTGIMAHTDGPLYYPVVTIVSLGTPCLFKFSPMGEQHYQVILFVEPRSLLTFRGAAYREWTHGIDYYDEDTILFDFDGTHIVRSNALNFAGSKWGKLAESKLQEMPQLEEEQLKSEDTTGTLIRLNNNEFPFALLLKRNLRVSLTLRHAFLPEELLNGV